ncbi:MAG: hypothetical protein HQ522_09640 [Bacteroidetes bacterium]|nr:hypothetical protein [Bacteroidota bacterium]
MKEKLIKALELEKQGDWNNAHEIVQDMYHCGHIGSMRICTVKNPI